MDITIFPNDSYTGFQNQSTVEDHVYERINSLSFAGAATEHSRSRGLTASYVPCTPPTNRVVPDSNRMQTDRQRGLSESYVYCTPPPLHSDRHQHSPLPTVFQEIDSETDKENGPQNTLPRFSTGSPFIYQVSPPGANDDDDNKEAKPERTSDSTVPVSPPDDPQSPARSAAATGQEDTHQPETPSQPDT